MNNLSSQPPAQTTTPNTGINKYRGICCKNKYEFAWLKNETCCFCCGVRCALLTLAIFMILDGIEEIAIAVFFLTAGHRSAMGCGLNMALGVSGLLLGVIGYIAIKTNNEKLIRTYWYITLVGIPLCISILGFAFIEFILAKNWALAGLMACDTIFAGALWIYISYKVKRYYDLVFSHYHHLGDGIKEEQMQKQHQTQVDKKTVQVQV
eukprot:UN05009